MPAEDSDWPDEDSDLVAHVASCLNTDQAHGDGIQTPAVSWKVGESRYVEQQTSSLDPGFSDRAETSED